MLAAQALEFRFVLFHSAFEETGLEDLGSGLLVLRLRPLVLALSHDAGG